MEAQVRKGQSGQQFSYDLPFHASDANVYPLLSPDGASVVVYGHEEGLQLYKIRCQGAAAQANPSNHDQHIAVDRSQDAYSRNQPKLERWLTIELESPVQHIAFPPIPTHFVNKVPHIPDSLTSNVIIAVSCADLTIVLISIPFTAQQDEDNDSSSRSNVKITYISEGGGHRNSISAIAVTWTAIDLHKPDTRSRSRSRGRGDDPTDESLSLLIASASTTGSGLLIVSQLPCQPRLTSKDNVHTTILRQLLHLPLLGSALAFNSSVHPSSDHLSLFLTSPAYGIVKIFDLARSDALLSKRRRGSETDNATPVNSTSTTLTLHTAHAGADRPCRKAIVDASWALSGQAILALLEDGEWGLWYTHLSDSTMHPGACGNRFTDMGQLTVTSPTQRSSKTKTSNFLAPMTPRTRKAKSADLFGQIAHPPKSSTASTSKTGQITLCSSSRSNTVQGDSFILSYDGVYHHLPSLQAFCQSRFERGREETAGTRHLQVLPEIRLGGGRRMGTHKIHALTAAKASAFPDGSGQTPDLVVLTETRLVIFSQVEAQATGAPLIRNLAFRNIDEGKPSVPRSSDTKPLDVEDIDKILISMEGNDVSTSIEKGRTLLSARSSKLPEAEGSADDTPEPPSHLAAVKPTKLVVDQKRSGVRRNLFASAK